MAAVGVVAVTGHQPPALGGFGQDVQQRLVKLAGAWLARHQPTGVMSGMAAGWDMAVAEAAVAAGVPLVAALAWPRQGEGWPEEARALFSRLLGAAVQVYTAFPARRADMWTLRDRWVIDRGDQVLALWSGAPGGTATAVAYAEATRKPVINLWTAWSTALC